MKKLLFVFAAMSCMLVSCSSDEPANPDGDKGQQVVYSVSGSEFSERINNRMWVIAYGEESTVLADGTVKPVPEITGYDATNIHALNFSGNECTRVYALGYTVPDPRARKQYDAVFNEKDGMITLTDADGDELLYRIESVSDTELVLHKNFDFVYEEWVDGVKNVYDAPGNYIRMVFKLATPEQQTEYMSWPLVK